MEETKICPHCGNQIKATARKCIHCKQWVDGSESHGANSKSSDNSGSTSGISPVVAIIAALAIVAFGVLIYQLTKSDNKESEEYVAEKVVDEKQESNYGNRSYNNRTESLIAEAIEEGFSIRDCPACGGTGDMEDGKCIICRDMGKVRVKEGKCEQCGCSVFIAPLNDSYCINCRETFGCYSSLWDHSF